MSDRNNTIGFIGMGMMGGGMAANLLKADFDMVAYDIDPAKNERFAGLGARIANGPAGVAQGASTVICIVETSAQIRDVVLGAIPYALIMVLFTILLIFVPQIVTWLPETMSGR